MKTIIYIIHIYYFRRYVTLGRPPPLSQSVIVEANGADEIYKRDAVRDVVMSWHPLFNDKSY